MRFRAFLLFIINILALAALLYMLDVLGLVNYYSMFMNRFSPSAQRTENLYLLEKQDLENMRLALEERAHDVDEKEVLVDENEKRLIELEETLNEESQKITARWQKYSNEMKLSTDRESVISDLANKWGNMPPQSTVAIILEHAKNGEDQLIIDVLLEMDRQSAASGASSITPYLLSLLPPDVSARLLEKYNARASELK